MRLLVSGATKAVKHWHARRPDRIGVLLRPSAGAVRGLLGESMTVAADNGCFAGLDRAAWLRMLADLVTVPGLRWVTAPDVVADSGETLRRFRVWAPVLRELGFRVALVGQDGLKAGGVPWDEVDAYFIGGSDAWKLSGYSRQVADAAKERGKWVHMGRVNTMGRFHVAARWGCDTADGSSFSKWSDTLIPKAVRWIDAAMGGELYGAIESLPELRAAATVEAPPLRAVRPGPGGAGETPDPRVGARADGGRVGRGDCGADEVPARLVG